MSVSAFIYGPNVFPTLVSGLMQLSVPTKREKSFEVQNLFAPDQIAVQNRARIFFEHLESSNSPLQNLLSKALLSPASKEIKPFFAVFKRALFKERGYVPRLFSDETWKEWTENRTDLGKVVSLFRDCVESSSSIDTFTKKLDARVLQRANENADALLKGIHSKAAISSCMSGFLGGTVASLLTKSPLPLLMGLSQCFPRASAQQKIGSEFLINTNIADAQERPSIASFSNGNFIVTWDSYDQDGSSHGVYGQLFNENGNKIGSEFQINTYILNSQVVPSVTSLQNGNFVVTWQSNLQDGDIYGIYGQLFNGNGSKIGSEFLVNNYTTLAQQDSFVTSLQNGDFIASWQSNLQDGSNWGIYGQLFNGNGSKTGNEFLINTNIADAQERPSIASFSNGNFIVTWDSYDQDGSSHGVYGQLFNENGNKIGSEFQINTYILNSQVGPSVTSLQNGNFVVTWESNLQDGDIYGIYGQLFNGNGSKIGSEFLVNNYTTLAQQDSFVTSLQNGDFIASWQSNLQDGSGWGIYGQMFERNGTKIGNEFQVNTFTANNQVNPSATDLSNNNFIVTWQSDLQDTASYGIYGQIFFDNISTSTSSTTTSSSTTSTTTSTSSTTTTSSVTTIKNSSTISTPLSSSSEISNELTSISPSSNRGFRWLWLILGGAGGATCLNLLGYYLFKKRPWQQKEVSSPSDQRELQAIEDPLRAVSKHDSRRDSEYTKLSDIRADPTKGNYANRPKKDRDSEYANRPKRADREEQYANIPDSESSDE